MAAIRDGLGIVWLSLAEAFLIFSFLGQGPLQLLQLEDLVVQAPPGQ